MSSRVKKMLIKGKFFNHAVSRLGCPPRGISTILLGISAVYAVVGGSLGLWYPKTPAQWDINLFYQVGVLAWDGINPYTGDYGVFAYPPAWITVCAILSLLPWWPALILWKLLNLFFLGGSVWFSLRLFGLSLTDLRAKLVISFACLLWPTLTTLMDGQTSLFVLFFLLWSIFLCREGKHLSAGATLCLSLMKPQLAAPLLMLLAWRRQFHTVFWASALFASLSYVGVWLSNATLSSYVQAIIAYGGEGTINDASIPLNVGIQNLSSILLNLPATHARLFGAATGLIFLIYLYVRDGTNRSARIGDMTNIIPLILLSGPMFFGAKSYDLVLIIPFFAWLLSQNTDSIIARFGAISCLALFVPLEAVKISYTAFLSDLIPAAFFELALAPFRSWVMLILLVSGLALYLKGSLAPTPAWGRQHWWHIDTNKGTGVARDGE
jgi:hypothetical protein